MGFDCRVSGLTRVLVLGFWFQKLRVFTPGFRFSPFGYPTTYITSFDLTSQFFFCDKSKFLPNIFRIILRIFLIRPALQVNYFRPFGLQLTSRFDHHLLLVNVEGFSPFSSTLISNIRILILLKIFYFDLSLKNASKITSIQYFYMIKLKKKIRYQTV